MKPPTVPVLLLVGLILFPIGCDKKTPGEQNNGNGSSHNRPTIGVSLLTLGDPFFVDMSSAMQERGEKLGYAVSIVSGELDQARQKNQVDDFITRGVDAIVLCPVDSQAIGTSIKKANDAGIPVFTADIACLAEGAKVVSHVATDNYKGGQLAAEAMVDVLGGTGTIAIIDHPEVESVILRTRGFEERLAELKQNNGVTIEIVTKLPGLGKRDRAFQSAEAVIQSHPNLSGFFAINDQSALGVVAALEKAGKLKDMIVIGFDGQPEAVEALKSGKIKADVIQHPKRIGSNVIQAVADYSNGKELQAEQLIAPTLLTIENLDSADLPTHAAE